MLRTAAVDAALLIGLSLTTLSKPASARGTVVQVICAFPSDRQLNPRYAAALGEAIDRQE